MGSEVLYLSRADVERVGLPMEEIIAAVETVLVEKGEGRVEMPAKIGIHPMADAYLRAAPAYLHSLAVAGVKWVSKFNQNPSKGLPTISGLLILNDPETGLPLAIMDCTWITAKRTGAASAVAAKYLARRDAAHLTIIGCGVQGRSHLEAMLVQFPGIRRIVAYDQRPATLARYVREMQATHGVPLEAATDCESAVRDADIIVTATEILKQPRPAIRPEWIKEGAFCMPIDFDAQFTPEAIQVMDLFYTDDTPQMESYRGIGYFAGVPRAQGDLGDLVTGKKPARTTAAQRTMSMQLGLAIEDMVTAIRIYERARAEGMGTRLPL
ncbi:MAG TPA: ornithine cyclodeaminase family protein [Candidatus Methylomirabilis sp.]|nr:ornithine cyclodeaminase family protein [Candidatus Methylomirabilis sp.]